MREEGRTVEVSAVSGDWDSGMGGLVTNDWWADAAVLPAEVSLASKKRTGTLQYNLFVFLVLQCVSLNSFYTFLKTYCRS